MSKDPPEMSKNNRRPSDREKERARVAGDSTARGPNGNGKEPAAAAEKLAHEANDTSKATSMAQQKRGTLESAPTKDKNSDGRSSKKNRVHPVLLAGY